MAGETQDLKGGVKNPKRNLENERRISKWILPIVSEEEQLSGDTAQPHVLLQSYSNQDKMRWGNSVTQVNGVSQTHTHMSRINWFFFN